MVPQARLVVALVTLIVVLTGILVGLLLRPPTYDPGGATESTHRTRLVRLITPVAGTEPEPPPYYGTIPEHQPRPQPSAPPPAAHTHREPPAPTEKPSAPSVPSIRKAPPGSRLAIVIDDAGNNLQELSPYLEFPAPLTFAVLPQLRHSARAAELIRSHGHEVILHLPMAAVSGLYPGPGTITDELSDLEIRDLLERNFASISGAVGTNNHMGSAGTADARIMDAVMAYLADTGRFFVDSRTTPRSVAGAYATKYGVPFMTRDVFLDHDRNPAAIRSALRQGLDVARRQGYAVLIGHSAVREVAAALMEAYPDLERLGYVVVPLSELIPFDSTAVSLSNHRSTSDRVGTTLANP